MSRLKNSKNTAAFIAVLDGICGDKDLLKHPFYQQWQAGKLSKETLKRYGQQYLIVVQAIPDLVSKLRKKFPDDPIMRPKLMTHAEEEYEHIELWKQFCRALGLTEAELCTLPLYWPTKQLLLYFEFLQAAYSAVYEWAAMLYVIESAAPAIAQAKLEGLRKFYGFTNGSDTEYFEAHQTVDIGHSQLMMDILRLTPPSYREKVLCRANRTAELLWNFLDGVMEQCPN